MRISAFIIIALFSIIKTDGQSLLTKHFIIGTETGGATATYIDPNTDEKFREYSLRFGPHIGVFLHPQLVVGAFGSYEWHRSDFGADHPALYGLGGYLRFYLPLLNKEPWKGYLLPFTEIAYTRLNYFPAENGQWGTSRSLDYDALYFIAGMNFRIFRQFHIEMSLRPRYFLPDKLRWSIRLGLEYHIGTYNKE